jgi:hypothetical protein
MNEERKKIKKRERKITKKSYGKPITFFLEGNGRIEGRSSCEQEGCVGFLGKVKDGVGCTNVGQNREGLGMVGDKGGVGLESLSKTKA